MERQLELILGVPLKVIAASYMLNLAADTAVKVVDDQWILKAHRLCRVIGMDGLVAFLGSFGLFLAFLICASGITAGFICTPSINNLIQPRAYSGTILIGLSIFAACAIAGLCVFFLFVMLVTLGLKGLLLIGFLLAAVLIMEYNNQHYSSRQRVNSARMLILFGVTFFTMLLAVQASYNVSNPSLLLLFPFLVLLGYSVDKIAFKKPQGFVILSFIIAVVLTGLVVGLSIEEYYLKNPVFSETANTLNSVVYKMVLLIGLVGAFAGALVAHYWIEEEANGLSLWICGPVAVILFNLDIGSRVSLHSLLNIVFGSGGVFGFITSFAACSGFSFGLALKHAHIMLPLEVIIPMLVILGLLFHYFITSINLFIVTAIVVSLGLLSTMEIQDRLVPLEEAAWDFAILAKVMMGATILGIAGLLTWPLGGYASAGLILALGVLTWKAITVSGEQ